jgi:hypothetical protein
VPSSPSRTMGARGATGAGGGGGVRQWFGSIRGRCGLEGSVRQIVSVTCGDIGAGRRSLGVLRCSTLEPYWLLDWHDLRAQINCIPWCLCLYK